MSYKNMKNRFKLLLEEINEELNTKRKGIMKVDQMSAQQFLRFLREFLNQFDDMNQLNIDNVVITEKIDGVALRLAFLNNELLFESSYSGLTTADKVPFSDAAIEIKSIIEPKFKRIFKNQNIKLIGELIWISDIEESGKVTPIAAKYLTNKFGEKGRNGDF